MLYTNTSNTDEIRRQKHGGSQISHVLFFVRIIGQTIALVTLVAVVLFSGTPPPNSVASTAFPSEYSQHFPAYLANDEEVDECGVVFHEISSIKLVSETADLPLTLVNTCYYDIAVDIDATSDDSRRLAVEPMRNVLLKANYSSTISLPVHAKANGEIGLKVQFSSTLNGEYVNWGQFSIEIYSARYIGLAFSIAFCFVVVVLLGGGAYRMYRRSRTSGT
jgi:hypothetical protein